MYQLITHVSESIVKLEALADDLNRVEDEKDGEQEVYYYVSDLLVEVV